MAGLIPYIARTNLLAELVCLQGRYGRTLFGFGDECGESGIAMKRFEIWVGFYAQSII
jgi:hypothetical protein